jgi:precorrin-3B synthase
VWEAADGGLARVRLPGGRLTPAQLRVLTDAAAQLGSGVLELTMRANVQVRGLAGGGEQALAARLRPAGLLRSDSHDRVRNILASPLHGLGPRPGLAELIGALDDALCDDEALAALPGRFLFALDDGTGDLLDAHADVTLCAAAGGWSVLLAGVPVGVAEDATTAVAAAIAAAHGFLDERAAQHSPAWRLAELADGPARVAARLPRLRPPGQIPGPGAPLAAGVHARADGGRALVLGVPDGRLDVAGARLLLAAAEPSDVLRVTPWRSVVLPTAPEDPRVDALRTGGFVVEE